MGRYSRELRIQYFAAAAFPISAEVGVYLTLLGLLLAGLLLATAPIAVSSRLGLVVKSSKILPNTNLEIAAAVEV